MKKISAKPESLKPVPFRFCPGCGHGLLHKIIAEIIDELGMREKTIGFAPVGCAVFAYDYFNFDVIETAHGRPPAVATAIKRLLPDNLVFTYQGDGDLAAIGTAEIVHAAARGENFSVIFVNNATYGMTGGQMAPTTLLGQMTTTTTKGREQKLTGYPVKVSEMLATLDGVSFICRTSMDSPQNVIKTKNAVKKAFQYQLDGKGFSFVEVLAPCPTDWWMSPKEALLWIKEKMIPVFPPGVVKDKYSKQSTVNSEQ
ncbi:MAG: 2-oxoglutarate oxidoreductase [Nitrospirae bacterium]|nr:2-oxoglutarate oxidoreductase [Nitrospirota bacterium]